MIYMTISRFLKYSAPVLLLGLLFFGCPRQDEKSLKQKGAASPDSTIVAAVNGDPITLAEFLERFNRAGFKPGSDITFEIKKDFLNRLIEQKMLLKEAQRRRLKVGLPEINARIASFKTEKGKDVKDILHEQGIDFEKWKADIWESLMIEKLLSREVERHVSVSQSEVRKYYRDNPDEFVRPEQVHVRQIVLSSEGEAQKVLALLEAGADFSSMARQYSTAPEAQSGGDLGFFAQGDMPPDFNVVFSLPVKGISGVVKSPYGFHIFKLEERRPAGRKTLEEVYAEIEDKLRREKQERRYQQWLKDLRSRTKLEVNYQALE